MISTLRFSVGGIDRTQLLLALETAGVQLNESAHVLLEREEFSTPGTATEMEFACVTVKDLGLDNGGTWGEVLEAGKSSGFTLCPVHTGPYARLAWLNQPSSDDPELRRHRAPDASVTIASPVISPDPTYPKGFYLRVVENVLWLRGYRCDETYQWNPTDQLLFAT